MMASATLRAAAWLAGAIAVAWSLFQIYAGAFALVEPLKFRIVHVAFALALAALHVRAGHEETRAGRFGVFPVAALVIAGGSAIYMLVDYERIVTRIPFVDDVAPLDYVFGLGLVVLVLEVTRRILGAALTLVTAGFIAYGFLGPWIPGALGHRSIPLATFVEINFLTPEGLLGVPTGVSAEVVVAAPMLIVPEIYTDLAGLAILLAVIARQVVRARSEREGLGRISPPAPSRVVEAHPPGREPS